MVHFIAGATSSIGKVLVKEALARGEEVTALMRPSSRRQGIELPGVRFALGDVTDRASLLSGMRGARRVTNLAAAVGADLPEAEWWRITRDGCANMLFAARELGVESYVQVSSLSVLGSTEPGELRDEGGLPDPSAYTGIYQRTKRAADELVRAAAAESSSGRGGLKAAIVYPAFGYGCSSAQSHASMAEMTLLRMAEGKRVAVMGSGRNLIGLAYYKDTARGIELAHEAGRNGEGYILVNGNYSFPEIWEAIAAVLGKKAPTRRLPLCVLKAASAASGLIRGEPIFKGDFLDMISHDWRFSNEKARRELGFAPLGLAESMAETWKEYRDQGYGMGEGR